MRCLRGLLLLLAVAFAHGLLAAPGGPGRGAAAIHAFEVPQLLPLRSSGAGSFQVEAEAGGERIEFVVDTGAAMVSISRDLLKRLDRAGVIRGEREVAVRLADGGLKLVQVRRLSSLRISDACELRDIEVLVLPGQGRNLLGLNALSQFAPITLTLAPPTLSLSHCHAQPQWAVSGH